MLEFSRDAETKKIAGLATEFSKNILGDEEPLFISDEATVLDVSAAEPGELLSRIDVDGRRVMQQAIQNGGRDDRVSENRTPVSIAVVGGKDDAAPFIPCTRQLEENRPCSLLRKALTLQQCPQLPMPHPQLEYLPRSVACNGWVAHPSGTRSSSFDCTRNPSS